MDSETSSGWRRNRNDTLKCVRPIALAVGFCTLTDPAIFGMTRCGAKPKINAIATLIILASVVIAALGLWLRSRKTD